jgi:membrane fusion protein (multidrug efflux system)
VDDAIFVQNQAIQRTAEGINKVVIIDKDNMVVDRNVVLGQEFDGRTQVISGLAEGEQVVVEGFTKIRAGQTVKPQAYDAKQATSEEPVSGSEAPAATADQ